MNGETRTRTRRLALVPIAAVTALALGGAVPSWAGADATVSMEDSTLTAFGDTGYDQITFSDENDPGCPGGTPCYQVAYYGGQLTALPPCVVTSSDPYEAEVQCPSAGVERIRAVGREGRDTLLVSEFAFGLAVPAVLEGGGDDDALTGSDGADRLIGGGGNDAADGRRANDVILGGVGRDRLDGARGGDRVVGGFGPDRLIGGTGADRLFGQGGADILDGQQGRDLCDGGKQKDKARNCERLRRIP